MPTRLVFAHCVVLLAALGVMIAEDQPAAQGAKKQAIELNQKGSESIQANKFSEAKSFFLQAIHLDPRLSDAYENLALLCLLEGSDEPAESWALQLMTIKPGDYNARFAAGIAAINQNQFTRGRNYLAPLLVRDATDPLVVAAYAVALKRSGNEHAAGRLMVWVSSMVVEERDARLAGQVFRQKGLQDVAEQWLKETIEHGTKPPNRDTLCILASIYVEQGRNPEAAELYRNVLQRNPEDVNTLVELSEIERKLGEQENALSHLYAARALAATDASTLMHFSQVCMRRHMFVDAKDALQKAVGRDPQNREAWYQLGLAQFRIDEIDAAAKDFETALKLDGNDEWSRVALGAVLSNNGRKNEAEAEFVRVLHDDHRCGAAYYYLAQIHREQGRLTLALQEMQQAVKYSPHDSRPFVALGQLQSMLHDVPSARHSFQEAIALDPRSATAHYALAMLLRGSGATEEARNEIELYKKYHDEESKQGIVGLVRKGEWDYPGFLPASN